MSELMVFSQHFGELEPDTSSSTIGLKARGIYILPVEWTPPFVVLTPSTHRLWKESQEQGAKGWLAALISSSGVDEKFRLLLSTPKVIVRSSAVGETIDDRGQYMSQTCESTILSIEEAIGECWQYNVERLQSTGQSPKPSTIALIVQPLLRASRFGHVSNERRVSQRHDSWLVEDTSDPEVETARISPVEISSFSIEELRCTGPDELRQALRTLVTPKFGRIGRRHYEWVWDGRRLWAVQCDFEMTPMGDAPGSRWVHRGSLVVRDLDIFVPDCDANTSFQKVDCVRAFRATELPTAQLFVLQNPLSLMRLAIGEVDDQVRSDVDVLARSPVVVRSDIATSVPDRDTVLLPRTSTCTDPDTILDFMVQTAGRFVAQNIDPELFCFLVHRFIPARAGTYSYARPGVSRVRTDATWGVPDGLLYYPHDSFEVDIEGRTEPWRKIRCKTDFIDFEPDGGWVARQSGTPWDWRASLGAAELKLIATQTSVLAEYRNAPVEVMHFVGVPNDTGLPQCIPWFLRPAEVVSPPTEYVSRLQAPELKIRTMTDISRARIQGRRPIGKRRSIGVRPTAEFLRDEEFVRQIAELAKDFDYSIDLQGSVLSHVYYMLRKRGVRVRAIDHEEPPQATGVQNFDKLVRDAIPDVIESHGERAVVRRIGAEELLRLLQVKVVEEAFELYEARDFQEILEEAADVFEVLRAMLVAHGEDIDILIARADEKRALRGGFEQGYVLKSSYIRPVVGAEEGDHLFEVEAGLGDGGVGRTSRWVVKEGSMETGHLRLSFSAVPGAADADVTFDDHLGAERLSVRVTRSGGSVVVQVGPTPARRSRNQLRLF